MNHTIELLKANNGKGGILKTTKGTDIPVATIDEVNEEAKTINVSVIIGRYKDRKDYTTLTLNDVARGINDIPFEDILDFIPNK